MLYPQTLPAADYYLKQGDLAPPLQVALTNGKGTRLPPLPAGSFASLTLVRRGTLTPTVAGATMGLTAVTINGVTYLDPTYLWQTGDTDIPGLYDVQVVVTYASGHTQTFPNPTPFTLYIGSTLPGPV